MQTSPAELCAPPSTVSSSPRPSTMGRQAEAASSGSSASFDRHLNRTKPDAPEVQANDPSDRSKIATCAMPLPEDPSTDEAERGDAPRRDWLGWPHAVVTRDTVLLTHEVVADRGSLFPADAQGESDPPGAAAVPELIPTLAPTGVRQTDSAAGLELPTASCMFSPALSLTFQVPEDLGAAARDHPEAQRLILEAAENPNATHTRDDFLQAFAMRSDVNRLEPVDAARDEAITLAQFCALMQWAPPAWIPLPQAEPGGAAVADALTQLRSPRTPSHRPASAETPPSSPRAASFAAGELAIGPPPRLISPERDETADRDVPAGEPGEHARQAGATHTITEYPTDPAQAQSQTGRPTMAQDSPQEFAPTDVAKRLTGEGLSAHSRPALQSATSHGLNPAALDPAVEWGSPAISDPAPVPLAHELQRESRNYNAPTDENENDNDSEHSRERGRDRFPATATVHSSVRGDEGLRQGYLNDFLASAPPARASIDRTALWDKVQDMALQLRDHRSGSASLRLSDGASGALGVRVEVTEGRVSLAIETRDEHVRQILQGDLRALADALAQQNLRLDGVSFASDFSDHPPSFAESSFFSNGGGSHPGGQSPSDEGSPRRTVTPRRGRPHLEIAADGPWRGDSQILVRV